MRGDPVPLRPRATVEDPPDYRVTQVRPRPMSQAELSAINRPGATDPRLRPADRWLERWAATHGSGLLPAAASVLLITRTPAKVPGLDDRESLQVDAIVHSSPQWARSFAVLWYRTACTVQEMADVLRIRRRQAVYEERHIVLAYYLGRFTQIGLPVTFWSES